MRFTLFMLAVICTACALSGCAMFTCMILFIPEFVGKIMIIDRMLGLMIFGIVGLTISAGFLVRMAKRP